MHKYYPTTSLDSYLTNELTETRSCNNSLRYIVTITRNCMADIFTIPYFDGPGDWWHPCLTNRIACRSFRKQRPLWRARKSLIVSWLSYLKTIWGADISRIEIPHINIDPYGYRVPSSRHLVHSGTDSEALFLLELRGYTQYRLCSDTVLSECNSLIGQEHQTWPGIGDSRTRSLM